MVIGGQGVVTPFCFQNSVDKMSSELGYFYSRAIFCGSFAKVEEFYKGSFSIVWGNNIKFRASLLREIFL